MFRPLLCVNHGSVDHVCLSYVTSTSAVSPKQLEKLKKTIEEIHFERLDFDFNNQLLAQVMLRQKKKP